MVSFRQQDRPRVMEGAITVTFRLWKTAKVKAGGTYRTNKGMIEIESIDLMPAGAISRRDIKPSGCDSIEAIWALAGEHTNTRVTADTLLYRVQFRYLGEIDHAVRPPPTTDLDAIAQRLARTDARSPRGPWTTHVLQMIESAPEVPARILAAELGWETLDFKAHVRRLKALGLTISHEVGYELSDLGRAYLASRTETAPKMGRRRRRLR